ncbi:MAG: hypothetical protein KGO96_07145 [Elusimicrobia bacterium]|nr:hypothetical protein [Elusimicrobiota bacterium]
MVPPVNPDCPNCKVLANECQDLKRYAWQRWEDRMKLSNIIFFASLSVGFFGIIVSCILRHGFWAGFFFLVLIGGFFWSIDITCRNSYPPGNNQ